MAEEGKRKRPLTYSEARSEWEAKHRPADSLALLVGCTRHTSLSWWQEPETGRCVAVVESVSQWPRIEDVVGTTQLVRETGPFDSLAIFREAAARFRREVEERYGRLT